MRSASLGDGGEPDGEAFVWIAFSMPPTVSCSAISKSTNCLSSGWVTLDFAIRLSSSDNEPNAVVSLMCLSRASVIALGAGAGGDVDCATTRLADNVAIEARRKRRFICGLPSDGRAFAPETHGTR